MFGVWWDRNIFGKTKRAFLDPFISQFNFRCLKRRSTSQNYKKPKKYHITAYTRWPPHSTNQQVWSAQWPDSALLGQYNSESHKPYTFSHYHWSTSQPDRNLLTWPPYFPRETDFPISNLDEWFCFDASIWLPSRFEPSTLWTRIRSLSDVSEVTRLRSRFCRFPAR